MANTTLHGWTLIALFIALTFAMRSRSAPGFPRFMKAARRSSRLPLASRARASTAPAVSTRGRKRSRGYAMHARVQRAGISSPTQSSGFNTIYR